jgi:hypothetical protein
MSSFQYSTVLSILEACLDPCSHTWLPDAHESGSMQPEPLAASRGPVLSPLLPLAASSPEPVLSPLLPLAASSPEPLACPEPLAASLSARASCLAQLGRLPCPAPKYDACLYYNKASVCAQLPKQPGGRWGSGAAMQMGETAEPAVNQQS